MQTTSTADNDSGGSPAASAATGVVPLFVDLDGTLIATDVFCESLVSAVKLPLRHVVRLPLWISRGRPELKRELSQHVTPDAHSLPYHADVIEFIKSERQRGRPIILATATARRWAEQMAQHLGLFDDVLASDSQRNLKGPRKLEGIEDYCREHGYTSFGYMGDARADLSIWRKAAEVYVVAPSAGLLSAVRRIAEPAGVFGRRPSRLRAVWKVMRPHQWVKNILLLAPLVLAHQVSDTSRLLATIWGFVAFCACASGVYVTNDLLDIEGDRRHPSKRRRPFASGALPVAWGPPLIAGLLGSAFSVSLACLPLSFSLLLAGYLVTTLLYSLWLKRQPLLDVLVLAGLYTLRIMAGGAAAQVPVSEWMMALSLFLFTSLAFAKRYTELSSLSSDEDGLSRGRGYRVEDLRFIESIGPTSGYLAVLVLALYINSPDVSRNYLHPRVLWLVCPLLLYWVGRLWLFASRRALHEDPVVFAVTDHVSLAVGVLVAVLSLAANLNW